MHNTDFLKEKIKQFPELPGIYKMLDVRGNIIYIGKSKCLKKRVQSYFTVSPKWEKVNRMVTAIKDIEYLVTDTHLEARLLECNLIKEHQPRFNAQMKNDQRYFFIKVEAYNPYRPLSVVHERETDCFGPFRSKTTITEFLGSLKNIYPIRENDKGYELEYHLFPIRMDQEVFERNREILINIFTKESDMLRLMKALQLRMEEAVNIYQYETASIYRDMIHSLEIIKRGLDGYQSLFSRTILLKLPVMDGFKLFYVSGGGILHCKKTSSLTNQIIKEFLQESVALATTCKMVSTKEKSFIDYRDIIYSEISSLSDGMYELL